MGEPHDPRPPTPAELLATRLARHVRNMLSITESEFERLKAMFELEIRRVCPTFLSANDTICVSRSMLQRAAAYMQKSRHGADLYSVERILTEMLK